MGLKERLCGLGVSRSQREDLERSDSPVITVQISEETILLLKRDSGPDPLVQEWRMTGKQIQTPRISLDRLSPRERCAEKLPLLLPAGRAQDPGI